MAAKSGRRAKPKKLSMRGCINYKANKPKMCFSTLKEGNDFLKKNNQFDVKEAYSCDICEKIHVGRRLVNGKQNGRSRRSLQNA